MVMCKSPKFAPLFRITIYCIKQATVKPTEKSGIINVSMEVLMKTLSITQTKVEQSKGRLA